MVPLLATITTSYTCSTYVNPSLSFSIDTLIRISQHQTNTIPSNGTGTRCNDNTFIVIVVFAVCVVKSRLDPGQNESSTRYASLANYYLEKVVNVYFIETETFDDLILKMTESPLEMFYSEHFH